MKKTLAAIIIIININILPLFSQTYDDIMINPFWSFYSENYLDAVSSGRGVTGIGSAGNLSSVYLNPAAIDIPGKFQADFQYIYRTNQDWLPFLGISDLYLKQNPFSGSAGVGYKPFRNLLVGVLYGNPNSFTINMGEIIITNEFGEELGRYNAYEKYIVHSFSLPIVYNFDDFRAALSLNYSLHRRYANFENDEFVGKFDRFNIQAGLLFTPNKNLSLGLSFIPEASGKVTGSSNTVSTEYTTANIPMKIGAGISYTLPGRKVKLLSDFTFTNTSIRKGLKDQFSFHAGMEYFVNKQWTLRAGFFNRQDPRDLSQNSWANPGDSYDQIFLTAGASLNTKNVSMNVAVLDSRLSSNLKITFINAGLALNF